MIDAIDSASTIYFDTAPLIYFIQANPEFVELVSPIIETIDRGDKMGLSSYLTMIEVLVQPLRSDRLDLAEDYRTILRTRPSFRLLAMDRRIAEEAARIRARYRFNTPDSIQLATAIVHGAEAFLTNDEQLRSFGELPVVVLGDYAEAE